MEEYQKYAELIRQTNIFLYGFDISKLSIEEQERVKQMTKRRQELEAKLEKTIPTPPREMTQQELIFERWLDLQNKRIERIRNGRPLRELTNDDLTEELEILKEVVEKQKELFGGED